MADGKDNIILSDMTTKKTTASSTIKRGTSVDKKPITDKQRAALDAGRKPYKKGEKRAIDNGQKGGQVTQEILHGEKRVQQLLALKPKNEDEIAEALAKFDLSKDAIDEETLMHIAAIGKAKDGDMAAYEKVLKAAGYLKDKVEASVTSIPDPVTNFID